MAASSDSWDAELPPEVVEEEVARVLAYLPVFEQPGFSPGAWKSPPGQFPYFVYVPEVQSFIRDLSLARLVYPFNWNGWHAAGHYEAAMAALPQADLLTIRRLLTLHVRADRFTEGHLATVFEDGSMVAILHRLRAIWGEDQQE